MKECVPIPGVYSLYSLLNSWGYQEYKRVHLHLFVLIQMGWAILAIWSAMKEYNLRVTFYTESPDYLLCLSSLCIKLTGLSQWRGLPKSVTFCFCNSSCHKQFSSVFKKKVKSYSRLLLSPLEGCIRVSV